ncbi:hypothetical protein GQR58_024063 [Nymphon striatum]|nr:hypothetical protein GQR58_024063 [Nymphon striatum]
MEKETEENREKLEVMMSRIGQELETWEMQKGKLKIKLEEPYVDEMVGDYQSGFLKGKPAGKRAVRRLKKDSAEEDLKLLGVKNWRQKTKDRPLWRKVAEEAKDLQGLR